VKSDSLSTKTIERILNIEFDVEVAFDQSRGEAHLTCRHENTRYRVYVEDGFESGFIGHRSEYTALLGDLIEDLKASPTHAVEVTVDGIEEHPGAEV
jgi:hypothetical protein